MTYSKLRSVLRQARLRLDNPRRWVKGSFTGTNDLRETTYCLLGAVKVGQNLEPSELRYVMDILMDAIQACGFRHTSVAEFNDSPLRKHPSILRVLDRAIAST